MTRRQRTTPPLTEPKVPPVRALVPSCGGRRRAIVGMTKLYRKRAIFMDARFPDADTLRTVMGLASRAPSVHNTQPWRWRLDAASVRLYSDESRQLPNTDPDGRDLILSCGAALHHCVVALAAVGWRSKVTRLPNPTDPRHLATIELSPHPADSVDIALAAAIPRRRTDRRYYSCWPVPVGDVALMAARAATPTLARRRTRSFR